MSIYYKIKLRPLEPYFFGKELSAELGNRQSYYQHSAIFPQQTSVLGMLRYQLLLLKGLIPLQKNGKQADAEILIGKQGFRTNNTTSNTTSFGKIKKLSPVLLSQYKNTVETTYIIRNREVVEYKNEETKKKENRRLTLLKPDLNDSAKLYRLGATNATESAPRLVLDNGEMYLAKYPFQNILHPFDWQKLTPIDLKKTEKLGEVSHSDIRIGIYKNFEGSTELEGFYKKDFKELAAKVLLNPTKVEEDNKKYKRNLEENWSFVFYAELEEEISGFEGKERPVTLGKEQSTFNMSVEKIDQKPPIFEEVDIAAKNEEDFKVILLSDAFISSESELYKNSLLVNAETKFFRHLETSVSEKRNYYNIPTKSGLFNLLKRGGVIYTKNPNEIAILLEKKTAFRNIGYNYFKIEEIN